MVFLVFNFLSRNKILGYFIGRYNLDSESKKILNKNEKYVSGVEITQFNESIYFLSFIWLIFVIIISYFLSIYFLVLLVFFPVILLFSNELEMDILTNDRIVIIKRTIFERFLRITNESSIALDDIVLMKYGRAPFNKNALYFSVSGFSILIFLLIVENYYHIDLLLQTPFVILLLLIILYLFWIGLRLRKRSLELSIIGVNEAIGIGRTKGVPLWFIYEIQTLIFDSIPSNIKKISPEDYKKLSDEILVPIQDLINATPFELHKKIISYINNKQVDVNDIYNNLQGFTKHDINKAFKDLRKKRFIYFDRKSGKWCLNRYRNVGITK